MNFEMSLPSRYHADGVMTVSDTLADYFADAGYPRARLCPIYYGYDAELFQPTHTHEPQKNDTSPVIVMHGSFDQHHLGAIARNAIYFVSQRRPAVIFRFVGQRTPALAKFVEEMRQKSPAPRIECTGFVPYAEVARHLAGASVGMVPYEESRGVHCAFVAKIVEYVGMGLPVVSTPLDSARRYFGKEPLVRFSEFDGPSFGEKVLSWLEEPLDKRRALAAPAVERVRTELNWRAISHKAIDFVESIQKAALLERHAS
jgi:glycosyltransferase involved in cell wall biosynthesis